MNVKTFVLMPLTNQTASFESDDVSVQRDLGYSLGVNITNMAADTILIIHLEASACDTETWAKIQGSTYTLTAADTLIYNVSQVYYKNVKVVGTIVSGSADLFIECTTKSG